MVPAIKAERPVSVQLADSRRDARQWASRAGSGPLYAAGYRRPGEARSCTILTADVMARLKAVKKSRGRYRGKVST